MLTTKLNAAGCTPWRVLITDAISVKVLSSVAKMSDLADVGVSGRWIDRRLCLANACD